MFLDIVRWWFVVQVLALLALPLSGWFFARLPDRGYSFTKPFALLLVGFGAWWVSMLGLGAFGRSLLWSSALVVFALGIVAQKRAGLRQLARDLRQQGGWIALQEALFVAALFVGIVLRWRDFFGDGPGLWHTEQPMDLTFLSGILASQQFPPQDPWLAGYPINYYYLGYVLVAALIRLAGVSIGVGYTLGSATIFAFTAAGVAGLVYNLINITDSRSKIKDKQVQANTAARRASIFSLQSSMFALVGVLLVLLAGNQVGLLQILAGSEKVVALPPNQLITAIGNGLGARETLDLGPLFPASEFDDTPQLVPADKIADFNAWWPSRAVWDTLANDDGTQQRYAITEFPFFSFLLGDLHPHVLSLPWSLLAIAVALNVLLRSRAPDFRSRAGIGRLALTGIVLGGLYAINSWDLPTYLLLYLGALALLYARLAPSPRHVFWAHYAQQAGAVLIASYALYFPFHVGFTAPTTGFPLGLAPARTGLTEFLVIFGLFAVPLLAFVLTQVRVASTQPAPTAGSSETIKHQRSSDYALRITHPSVSITNRWPLFGLIVLLVLGIAAGWSLFALLPVALVACLAAYDQRDKPGVAFALWAFALGALVVWGTDVVFLRDNYSSPRMNTLFKFYYQVWLIWGALAAFALWALWQRSGAIWQRALWLVPFMLLLWGAAVYPVLAPADMPAARTLDGLAYIEQQDADQAAAIAWINANTAPNAVIVQAPGQAYNSKTARVASATGRPTVIGWTQHERVWRGGQAGMADEVRRRENDVIALYTTTDAAQAQALMDQYGIDYVYVGAAERQLIADQTAPADALAKFDMIMQRVFEQGDVVIYGRR